MSYHDSFYQPKDDVRSKYETQVVTDKRYSLGSMIG